MNKYAHQIELVENFHPGEFIKDELDALDMLQKQLAERMQISKTVVSELINGKRNLTPMIALKLEAALGIDAEFWMKLQVNYEVKEVRKKYRSELNVLQISSKKKENLRAAI